MDRKRELDVTKERMDGLVEKLYVGASARPPACCAASRSQRHRRAGREKGLELRGAIDSHLERYGQHTQAPSAAAGNPEPPSSAEQAPPPPPSPAAAKADTSAGPARTPPSSHQAKLSKTPEAGTTGYAALNRAGKVKTPN